ncbi:MAG: hypothetical protein ACYSR8_09785, partial [Planctomycetota bacterium]
SKPMLKQNQDDMKKKPPDELMSEEEIGLPPILPWLALSDEINMSADEKRLMSVSLKAYSLVGFTHNNQLTCKQKEELLWNFQTECQTVLWIVSNQIKLLKFNSPQDRLNYYKDYDSFCNRLIDWTKQSVLKGYADKPKFRELMNEQLSLYTRSGVMYNITKDEIRRIVATLKRNSGEKGMRSAGIQSRAKIKLKSWKNLIIEVVDNQTIRYKILDKPWLKANFGELGFLDKRTGFANQLWNIFLTLAKQDRLFKQGEPASSCPLPRDTQKDIDRIRETLRNYFGLQDKPIIYDRRNHRYRCMFKFHSPEEVPDWHLKDVDRTDGLNMNNE